jgi:hypothetical protein
MTLAGFDVVEVCPDLDDANVTSPLAAATSRRSGVYATTPPTFFAASSST